MSVDVLTPRHGMLLKHWRSTIDPEWGIPARDRFDAVDVPTLLSFLIMADIEGPELRFRVVGTEMSEAWGHDFTGQTLAEIMSGPYHDFIRSLFDSCIESRAPVVSHSRFQWDRGRHLDTIRLMVPFAVSGGDGRVGHVLVGQSFDYEQSGPELPSIFSLRDGAFSELSRTVLER